jgi:hypothetical protein
VGYQAKRYAFAANARPYKGVQIITSSAFQPQRTAYVFTRHSKNGKHVKKSHFY